MATLKAKYLYQGKKYAEIGDNIVISEDGDIVPKRVIESDNNGDNFDVVVDHLDAPENIEVDDSSYETAEEIAELIESVVKNYEENPPKTFGEDLEYEFNDDDPNEWIQYYE